MLLSSSEHGRGDNAVGDGSHRSRNTEGMGSEQAVALRLSSRVMLGTHKISNTNDVAEKSGVVAITVLLEIIHLTSEENVYFFILFLSHVTCFSSSFFIILLGYSGQHSALLLQSARKSHRLFLYDNVLKNKICLH